MVWCYKQEIIDILKDQYHNLMFSSKDIDLNQQCYAHYLYTIGSVYDTWMSPFDFRFVGLKAIIPYLLNIDLNKIKKAKLNLTAPRKIKDKYVVINTYGSTAMKSWIK